MPFQKLVAESGVSEAFAHNPLDGDLIRQISGRICPEWDEEYVVRVPDDFGPTQYESATPHTAGMAKWRNIA